MGIRWVAGSVRARALPHRRLGTAGTRALAACRSLDEAVGVLATSPYGRFVHAGDTLAAAQRRVAETVLWNLRVLAGWIPPDGVRALRLLAGWFEVANVEEHMRALTAPGGPVDPPFRLGALASAWPRLASTASPADLRAALAHSPWGDPGGDGARSLSVALRLGWADRLASGVPPAAPWAAGAVALFLARESAGWDPSVRTALTAPAASSATRLLGTGWTGSASLTQFAAALPPAAAWVLRDVHDPVDLWRAEARWWARLRGDGLRLLTAPGFDRDRAIGAAALLAVDAWQVCAALEVAARGATQPAADALEVLDAVA